MAKIFKGDVNFGFVINQTGAQPLDSRSVVQNYAELLKSETFGTAIYNGMTVATIDEQKVYMLVDKTKATLDEGWKEIGSGSGSLAISAFTITAENKIAEATAENIGQIIYVTSGTESYPAGPYIVIADGEVSKLGTTTATGDIAGDVEALKTRVSTIESDYVTETELTEAINGIVIPEVPVKNVIYGEDSILDDNGVADLSDFAKTSELEAYVPTNGYVAYSTEEKAKLEKIEEGAEVNYVKYVGDNLSVDGEGKLTVDMSSKVDVDGYVAYSTEEKNKLAGIAEGAEVNVIETIKVNEVELTVTDKAVNIDLSNYVDKNNYVAYSTEEKTKLAGIAEGAEVNFVKFVGDNLSVDGEGKLTVSIPEVEVPFQSVAENDKVLTLNDGVLSSTLTYTRENVEGVDSLVLKGVNNEVIGSVPVADFVADGMLESVTPVEGTNKFLFTFKTGNGTTESFEVDFSKYVDTYNADGETIELGDNNTFKVKENVFDAYGAAEAAEAAAKGYADTELAKKADKATTLSGYGITDAYTSSEVDTKLDGKADKATTLSGYGITDAYTKDEVGAELAKKVDNDTFETVSGKVDNNITVITKNTKDIATKAAQSDLEALAIIVGNETNNSGIFEKLSELAGDVANKLTKSATVNGKSFSDDGALVIDSADINLKEGFGKKLVNEEEIDRYTTGNTIQYVLKDIDTRIDAINTTIDNVTGGGVIADITEGDGISVDKSSKTTPTVSVNTDNSSVTINSNKEISVKLSTSENNALYVDKNGLFVQAITIEGDDIEGENSQA